MVDVLVLDEADRMIADGHFKEMRDILAHIYQQRVKIKLNKPTEADKLKHDTIQGMKSAKKDEVIKELDSKVDIDWSKV